jgi:hypothetical protein
MMIYLVVILLALIAALAYQNRCLHEQVAYLSRVVDMEQNDG